ncbi:hypothetical protein FS764_19260 [Agrobacterium vitis]|nr:hypothetical protein [Agrobacterium vitis]
MRALVQPVHGHINQTIPTILFAKMVPGGGFEPPTRGFSTGVSIPYSIVSFELEIVCARCALFFVLILNSDFSQTNVVGRMTFRIGIGR